MWPPKDALFFWKICHLIVSASRLFTCRLHIEGHENVPAQGGAIIACNHPGEMDTIVLGYSSPRQIFYMAKEELFQVSPLLSWMLYNVGAFPVRRGRQDVQAIQTSIRIVREGKVLGMFPEGTRNRDRGLTRGRNGAVRIALQTNAPIVPAAVIGIGRLNREWKNPLRRPPVTIRFGPPIHLDGNGNTSQDQIQAYTDQVMTAIAAMLPPDLRGVYADGAEDGGRPMADD
ncbi:MAG: lysophospholipid acyltransferase family protein [Caldilineaceae bacterium]